MYSQVLPVDASGRIVVDLEFKAFFVELVQRTYSQGRSLGQIREDIATLRRDLRLENQDLGDLPLEQWAEETIFALKRAAQDEPRLEICQLCGKVGPSRETNCASFCPYSA
jgi:hypothetical protein